LLDGDILWSTTQERKGAKYKWAGADAAEKAVRQLLWALEQLEKAQSHDSSPAPENAN
jgi:hypothetical protein